METEKSKLCLSSSSSEMLCFRISIEERDKIIAEGYNPVLNVADLPTHKAEWYAVLFQIRKALLQKWNEGNGDADFFLDTEWHHDRCICVEVTNERMLCVETLWIVQQALRDSGSRFAVDICNGWVFLRTRDGENFPNFNLFVEVSRVAIYSESDELYGRFSAVCRK